MLYNLLNRVFGWDYIWWKNSVAYGIARVHVDALGNPYYWRYKGTKCLDKINSSNQVVWLTCNPNKYIKNEYVQHI